jgi:hypothetical protein
LRKTSDCSNYKINNNNSNTVIINNWAAFPFVLQSKYTPRLARFPQAVFATSHKTLAQSIQNEDFPKLTVCNFAGLPRERIRDTSFIGHKVGGTKNPCKKHTGTVSTGALRYCILICSARFHLRMF